MDALTEELTALVHSMWWRDWSAPPILIHRACVSDALVAVVVAGAGALLGASAYVTMVGEGFGSTTAATCELSLHVSSEPIVELAQTQ